LALPTTSSSCFGLQDVGVPLDESVGVRDAERRGVPAKKPGRREVHVALAVLVALVTPAERFGALLALLGDAGLGELVRGGARVLVLSWSRNARGDHVGEAVPLTPTGYPRAG
jgi:hypothetical protein